MLLGVVVLVFSRGRRGVLWSPRGDVFSPSPCPAPVSSLTQEQASSLPSAPQLEVHLLCMISPLAIGYVYHQCTIFVAEVCMPHLGKDYLIQMGLSYEGIHCFRSFGSYCHWDRKLETNYSPN